MLLSIFLFPATYAVALLPLANSSIQLFTTPFFLVSILLLDTRVFSSLAEC
jgi:hypothetical protein